MLIEENEIGRLVIGREGTGMGDEGERWIGEGCDSLHVSVL